MGEVVSYLSDKMQITSKSGSDKSNSVCQINFCAQCSERRRWSIEQAVITAGYRYEMRTQESIQCVIDE